jgi:HK97 family phage major capsid protein
VARQDFDVWIPEEWDGPVLTRVNQVSAVEALARREPMGTDTKHVPRSGGMDVATVAKGAAYSEDTNTNDDVLLTARKVGKVLRVADEDLNDVNYVSIIAGKQRDWATSYAKYIDNATLGVTAVSNGTTIPFNSLYYQLSQSDSATGYTGNANITASAISYDALSSALGIYEQSDYFDDADTVVIAHPSYKQHLRGIKDNQLRPIFQEGDGAGHDRLFGYPVRYSLGARKHATATASPTGFPLLIIGNRQFMILGVRSGPESKTAGADTGAAFLTDEALLKMRARRGWNIGHENAFAIFEKNA